MASQSVVAKWVGIVVLTGVFLAVGSPRVAEAQFVSSKRCSNCQTQVPVSSQVGGKCPNCGAYWSYEQYGETSSGSAESGYQPQDSRQTLAFWQAMVMQQWLLERQARLTRMAELRDKIVADREKLRERVRERTEVARAEANPARRAEECLTAAAQCEAEGDAKAAAAYYRSVVRTLPDSSQAREAKLALSRLGMR